MGGLPIASLSHLAFLRGCFRWCHPYSRDENVTT